MSKLPFEDEILAGDVRAEWDNVLPRLLEIKERFGAHWRTEDIYAMCRNEEAFLYMFQGGFVIAGRVRNGFSLKVELHLYAVFSERKDSCMQYMPFFEGLAKEIGAESITMESSRSQEAFMRYGFTPEYTRYKRSLCHDDS